MYKNLKVGVASKCVELSTDHCKDRRSRRDDADLLVVRGDSPHLRCEDGHADC